MRRLGTSQREEHVEALRWTDLLSSRCTEKASMIGITCWESGKIQAQDRPQDWEAPDFLDFHSG